TPIPDPDLPLFNPGLISEKVLADLPTGYTMRPLCRGDYNRGYMEVLRVVGRTGWVGEDIWDERVEWLRTQSGTYYILVVVNLEDKIVASGTCLLERKFIHNMGVVGHVEDLAVARDQKGKKMGLRVLEALVHIASCNGAYKTMVNCTEANEAFHAQTGFVREGSQMVLHHSARRTPAPEHWV
ncbi:putative glucosamine 6-phosphate acetyltransferase, partial [Tothia fuscella]